MIVTQQDFEAQLERARAAAKGPTDGLYGPGSMTWRIAREAVVFLGAGRAALLQLAHPYVAHAIEQHSATRADPVGRFNRTFQDVYGMIFGDLETALGSARRVRKIHDHVHGPIDEDVGRFERGHRYRAHDADALFWVFATLTETSVIAYEIGVGPLSLAEKNSYLAELGVLARLFGIPDALLPPDWPSFEAYCRAMFDSDTIAVGRPARETARFLLAAPSAALAPTMRWYTTITAGMLPPRIREQYGFAWSRAEALAYRGSLALLARGWTKIPSRARRVPAYVEAERRIDGRPRPDRVGRALEQLLLRTLKPRGDGAPA